MAALEHHCTRPRSCSLGEELGELLLSFCYEMLVDEFVEHDSGWVLEFRVGPDVLRLLLKVDGILLVRLGLLLGRLSLFLPFLPGNFMFIENLPDCELVAFLYFVYAMAEFAR